MIFMSTEKMYALYPKADFRGELVGIYLVEDNLERVRFWGWTNYSILRQCLLVDCTDLSIYLLMPKALFPTRQRRERKGMLLKKKKKSQASFTVSRQPSFPTGPPSGKEHWFSVIAWFPVTAFGNVFEFFKRSKEETISNGCISK